MATRDEMIIKELESKNIKGFTPREKLAITELAELNHGAMVFLILGLNSRIRDLEKSLSGNLSMENSH